MRVADVGGRRGEAVGRAPAVPVAVAGTALAAGGLAGVRVGGVAFDVPLRDGVAVVPGAAALGGPPVVVTPEAGRRVRVGAVLVPPAALGAAPSEGVPAVRRTAAGGADDPFPAAVEGLGATAPGRVGAEGARVAPPFAARGPPLVGSTHWSVSNRICWGYCIWRAGGPTGATPSSTRTPTRHTPNSGTSARRSGS